MIELITGGLAVTTAIGISLAFIYRRGKAAGIDVVTDKQVKKEIKDLKKQYEDHRQEDTTVHKGIFKKIDGIDSKIDRLTGAVDIIKSIVTKSG